MKHTRANQRYTRHHPTDRSRKAERRLRLMLVSAGIGLLTVLVLLLADGWI